MTEPAMEPKQEKEVHPFFRDDVDPSEFFGSIEAPLGDDYKPDMTGEPLWKRIWYKILRIT